MTPLDEPTVTYLLGSPGTEARPREPFDDVVCEFLSEFSARLRYDKDAVAHNDLAALSFWCRRAHIRQLKEQFATGEARLGLGKVFHVAPSNVPVNFFYSYVFGLLAGNANVVRLPTKESAQEIIIFSVLDDLLSEEKFEAIRSSSVFVRYPHDDAVTSVFSKGCDARVIWGGDETIAEIRRSPVPVRAAEIAFADRYSFCVMTENAVRELDDRALSQLVSGFYNDSYLMDQNACSSPHLVVWLGGMGEGSERFWSALEDVVERKYDLAPVHAVSKYTELLSTVVTMGEVACVKRHGNAVYRIELSSLPADIESHRGHFGSFFEYAAEDIKELAPIVSNKYQTLTYFGVEKSALSDFVVANHLSGIDRIVPVGSALDIDVNWDGINVLQSLSRLVKIQ